MVVAGHGGAGKSEILEIIARLLTGKKYKQSVLPYSSLGRSGQRSRVVTAMLQETNVFPIILDEIDLKVFEKNSAFGRDNIKTNTSSLLGKNKRRYPGMILATNFDGSHSLPFEYSRRIYYFEVSETFVKNKEEGDRNLRNIYKKITSPVLFQDFLVTFQEHLLDSDFETFRFKGNIIDFLWGTRKIFRDYYSEVNRPLPEYFPSDILSEYIENGRNQLALLVKKLGADSDIFNYNQSKDILYVKSTVLDELLPTKNRHEPLASETYKQFVRNDLLLENESDRLSFAVRGKAFFNWIEVKNPYENHYSKFFDSWFKKRKASKKDKA